MVANVFGGGADAGEVAKVIRERRPDLVSLPEARVDVRQDIEAHLQGLTYHGSPPLPSAVTTWKQDLQVLKKWCAAGEPTIVAGDFNATVDHADFRKALGPDCRTVSSAVGQGFQGTWPSDRPRLARTQLDHVVVTKGIHPGRFTTYEIEGSDHRAAVARVDVPKLP